MAGNLPPAGSYSGKWGSNKPYKSSGASRSPHSKGGGGKPPKKGGLCIQIAPVPSLFGLGMLVNAIVQSFI